MSSATTEPKEYMYSDDLCTIETSSIAYWLKQLTMMAAMNTVMEN